MKQLLAILILAIAAFICCPASANIWDGYKAYDKGDYATALREFKPYAEKRHTLAQFYLGVMYKNGWGVPQDFVLAHMWFNLAAASNEKDAAEYRDIAAEKMTPEQIAEAQKLARECVAKDYQGC